jgi:FkbH-like protein
LTRLELAEFFLCPEIHNGDKAESLARIAERLKVRPVELAFLDNDPFQRMRVATALPQILVLDAAESDRLLDAPNFRHEAFTMEGCNRRHLVRADLEREKESSGFGSLEAFLATCELSFVGRQATVADIYRIEELAARTNRMNVADRRTTRGEISSRLNDPRRTVLVGSLRDRFGDYGTVAAAFLDATGEVANVDGLWISCRVGQRGLPATFFTFLAEYARSHCSRSLSVEYHSTELNRLGAFHLGLYGFRLGDGPKGKVYQLDLTDGVRPYPTWMTCRCCR